MANNNLQDAPGVNTVIVRNGNTQNNTTPDQVLTNNWWGTTNMATIQSYIWDYYDDATLGKVTFYPILTEPNPEAPTP